MMPKEVFWSGLKGGLFEEKHYRAMRESIWFFGWLCVRQSQINESGEGLPHYGNPLRDEEVSADTGFSIRTIQSWRTKLIRTGYIHTTRVGNAGLVYFIHKAKHKAKNPKPSTRYFPAELQPSGNYKVSHNPAGLNPKVSQHPAGTCAETCDTYAANPSENQVVSRNAKTLTPKHLSNYKTDPRAKDARSPLSSFKEILKEKTVPRSMSAAELDARRRELLLQGEEIMRKHPAKGSSPGKVLEMQPVEVSA
jgi:hypothetical protein